MFVVNLQCVYVHYKSTVLHVPPPVFVGVCSHVLKCNISRNKSWHFESCFVLFFVFVILSLFPVYTCFIQCVLTSGSRLMGSSDRSFVVDPFSYF